jgi:hypothetical protein
MIRAAGKTWCREHLNEYQRDRYAKLKAEREVYLITHDEFGDLRQDIKDDLAYDPRKDPNFDWDDPGLTVEQLRALIPGETDDDLS